jgi:CDP-diacylglycerol--glycerol-3-phosphate 3-phosphatidyltransferase
MKSIPYLLILTRFLLAPTIVLIAYQMNNCGFILAILMTIGLLTDIFDGIIARKLSLSTEKLRRMDSQTDLIFWLAIGYASWLLQSDILKNYVPSIVTIFSMEILCYAISIVKFKRETCTHAYLSKLFGLAMFAAFFNLLAFGQGGPVLVFAIIVGLISHLDRILITLILPHWTFDVPSFYHAYQIRKGKEIKKYKLFN